MATVEEIDDAIRFGAGLRWAAMGTFLTYRLAGGEAGMRHFMAQFGPALQLPWTRLTEVPELTDALLDKLVAQSDAQARRALDRRARATARRLPGRRAAGLRGQDFGAGEMVRPTERRGCRARPGRARRGGHRARWPLHLHDAIVTPEWIDYNGHMTEYRYLQVMGDATDALPARDRGRPGLRGDGLSYYTVETHLRHLGEAHAGDRLSVTTRLLGHDTKRLHLFHELHRSGDDALVATGEHMLLHVDASAGRAAPAEWTCSPNSPRSSPARPAYRRPRGRDGASRGSGWRPARPFRDPVTVERPHAAQNSFEPICAERAERLVYVRRLKTSVI